MDKHRTALPAITRDAVTGEHRAIAVDDERDDDEPVQAHEPPGPQGLTE